MGTTQSRPTLRRRSVIACTTPVAGGTAGVEPWWTAPNVVTVARTVGSVVLGVWAITSQSLGLLATAYGAYWLGDMLDGYLARRLGQETTPGAVGLVLALCLHQAAAGAVLVTLVLLTKLWSLGRVRRLLIAGSWAAPCPLAAREPSA